jgi:hypothetical protein
MSLRCFFLRRSFLPYLVGDLGSGQAGRLERHLAACGNCSDLLARTRAGHEAGRQLGPSLPQSFPCLPEFEDLRPVPPPARALSPSVAAAAVLAVTAALMLVFVVGRGRPAGSGFTRLAIREFTDRSHSRVVTEGFVRQVYYDEQERTLHIKLAEEPHDQAPFVICEVRDSRGLEIPSEGSRIRVYGQARFDAQPGRGWHEVNPVLDIAVLNR